MLVNKDSKFIDSEKPSKVTKSGVRIISEMNTSNILWYVACKHQSGLKTLSIVGLVGYIAYDKLIRLFV